METLVLPERSAELNLIVSACSKPPGGRYFFPKELFSSPLLARLLLDSQRGDQRVQAGREAPHF